MAQAQKYDVIIYGATGYTGRLVAEYMAKEYGANADIRWAIAGRSEDKLSSVKADLGIEHIAHILADASSPQSLQAMAEQARCVVSTVGPYALFGEPLIAACVETGTDYVDLTGEPLWMKAMIDTYGERAKQTGARIVHSCGFDSIPFDLGVQYVQEAAIKKHGAPFQRVRGRMVEMKGGASGGTLASGAESQRQVSKDPALLKAMINPFLLADGFQGPQQPPAHLAVEEDGNWLAPFFMAVINVKTIHRSNALLDFSYGQDFAYDEMFLIGPGERSRAQAEGLAKNPLAALTGGKDLPQPGEGPSQQEREDGCFLYRAIGDDLTVEASCDCDPGYAATSKMIIEAALCLIEDCPESAGGFHTTASAMGATLRNRLHDKGVINFALKES